MMKFTGIKLTIIGLVAIVFFAAPALVNAQMIRSGVIATNPMYTNVSLSNLQIDLNDYSNDFSMMGLQLAGGYNLSNEIAVEGRLGFYGDDSDALKADAGMLLGAYGRYNFGRLATERFFEDPPERLQAYVLAGLTMYEVDWTSTDSVETGSVDDEHTNLSLGFGFGGAYEFTDLLEGTFEVMAHLGSEDIDLSDLNISDSDYTAYTVNFGLTYRL